MISASAKDSQPCHNIWFKDDGTWLYASNTDNMKVYDLEANKVLDIVMKPHHKNLDLKYNDEYLFIADQTSKSVIVSSVKEDLINYDVDVKISKTVTSGGVNPFKGSFYKKSNSTNENAYGTANQGTAKFGRSKRKASVSRSRKSILANNGINLMKQNSYNVPKEKDPYTGKRYDFSDFDDVTPKPQVDKYSPFAPASPPTMTPMETREIVNKITNNHNKVLQLMKHRKSQLWNLQQSWTSGNWLKTLRNLYQLNDTPLVKDFLEYTLAKNESLEFMTLESASIVLRLLKMIIVKPHTEFHEWAKKAYYNLFTHVKPVSLWIFMNIDNHRS